VQANLGDAQKVMVIGDRTASIRRTAEVEIIDLKNPNAICPSVQDYKEPID